jgi:hypothetical protein
MDIGTAFRRAIAIDVPRDLTARERWYYGAAAAGQPASIAGHSLFVFVFWYWGIWQMALYNVASVALWAAMPVLLRQRKFHLHYLALATEAALFAILSTLFLGWPAGLAWYFILIPLVAVLRRFDCKAWRSMHCLRRARPSRFTCGARIMRRGPESTPLSSLQCRVFVRSTPLRRLQSSFST